MAGLYCAPGMRREGNQSNQSNRRSPQRGHGKHRGTILSRREGGREWVVGCVCVCVCVCLGVRDGKIVQKRKKKKKIDFGRTFLKLCWVMIG